MRLRFDSVSISSVLLTICLVAIGWWHLKYAATWRTREWMMDRVGIPNFQASMAFASLALVFVGLIVLWTGYQTKTRSSWFIMLVFVLVYFMPVNLIDVFLDIRRVGWSWWPGVIQDAREGRTFAVGATRSLAVLALMVIALVVPIRAFFGKQDRAVKNGSPESTTGPETPELHA